MVKTEASTSSICPIKPKTHCFYVAQQNYAAPPTSSPTPQHYAPPPSASPAQQHYAPPPSAAQPQQHFAPPPSASPAQQHYALAPSASPAQQNYAPPQSVSPTQQQYSPPPNDHNGLKHQQQYQIYQRPPTAPQQPPSEQYALPPQLQAYQQAPPEKFEAPPQPEEYDDEPALDTSNAANLDHGAPSAAHFVGASTTQDDVGTFNGGSYRISHRDTNTILTLQLAMGCPLTAKPGG
jgi:hypothetical protein